MLADWKELDAALANGICDGACPVKIVGNVLVGDHLEYIISSRSAVASGTKPRPERRFRSDQVGDEWRVAVVSDKKIDAAEATLLQRRYSDFVRLRRAITPIAYRHGLAPPSLPSKYAPRSPKRGALSASFGLSRQLALDEWLKWVVSHQDFWHEPLAAFLTPSSLFELDSENAPPSPAVHAESPTLIRCVDGHLICDQSLHSVGQSHLW